MSVQVLFISFKFDASPAEYAQAIKPLVNEILNASGLRWKIWLINEVDCVAGGIYLFDDASFAQMFIKSALMTEWKRRASVSNIHITSFDVIEAETALTHGPIGKGVRV